MTHRRAYTGETGGYYVSVQPDEDSRDILFDWAARLGFWVKPEDFVRLHCTVIYTHGTKPDPAEADPKQVFTGTLKGFTHWIGFDGLGYLVALIDSPSIVERRLQWIDRGAGAFRKDFNPHVTLAVNVPCPAAMVKRMKRLSDKERGTVLRFSGEHLEDIR